MSYTRGTLTYPKNAAIKTRGVSSTSEQSDEILLFTAPLNTQTSTIPPLPREVLRRIFISFSSPAFPIVYLPPRRNFYPWILGHICHQWREALWNFPDIWSTIHIVKPRLRNSTPDDTLIWTILSDILARTTVLIYLTINWQSYTSDKISSLIKSFSRRFRSLTVCSSSHTSLYTLLELEPRSLPHLVRLSLLDFGPHTPPSMSLPATNHLRPDLPSLQTLIIDGGISAAPYLRYLPLAQLTHIELSGRTISTNFVHYTLQQCSSLVVALFFISEEVTGTSHLQTPGTIASPIQCVTLSTRITLDWNVFLTPLFFPKLSTFSVSHCSSFPAGLGTTFPPAIISLVNRSKCILRAFSVLYNFGRLQPDIEPPHPDLTEIIRGAQQLETFASGYIAVPEIINRVHGTLTQLKSVSWRVEPEGLGVLLDLLDDHISRKSSSSFPHTIYVTCCDGDGFSSVRMRFLDSYSRYKEVGVDIAVRNVENNDIRFIQEWGKESDVSSHIGSVWAAGLGDDVLVERSCCRIQ